MSNFFLDRSSEIAMLKPFKNQSRMFNPLLHRLFLDHDIIFYFKTLKKFKKNLSKVLNNFENMENGAFAPNEQMLHFR